jgi:RNase P/RNase MRP subunit p29
MNWPDIFFKARPARSQAKSGPKPPESLPAGDEAKREAASLPGTGLPTEDAATGRLPVSQVVLPPAPVHSGSSDTTVVREMAEADTLREMTRSGGIRLIKRDFSFPASLRTRSTAVPFAPKTSANPSPAHEAAPKGESAAEAPSPAARPPTIGASLRSSPAINLSGYRDATAPVVARPAMTIYRRRTKIADVARIVLPPRRDDSAARAPVATPAAPEVSQPVVEPPPVVAETPPVPTEAAPVSNPTPETVPTPIPPPPEEHASTSAVVPPSFPVEIATGTVLQSEAIAAEMKPVEEAKEVSASPIEALVQAESAPAPSSEAENKIESKPEETTPVAEAPAAETASAPETTSANPTLTPPPPADTREKREFVLSNGERIFGHILSETPESIYIDHGTLGVLTIARSQIAQRPVEIILINGDRIVGDIIAETADSLFVRHASLGILTVPRNQRSNRVVEAILKDGDRILGEVLGETENFTVIRSATLGTVAVPHNRVAMLNRRAEQVQMRALPAGTALENKTGG